MLEILQLVDLTNSFDLETSRLIIQRFTEDDIEEEIAQDTNPDIVRYIKDVYSYDVALERAESIVQPWKGEELEWVGLTIRLKEQSKMMGAISFRFQSIENKTVEIGYRIHPNYHNNGYVTEATKALMEFLFNTVKVHKIVAYCVEENTASWKVMQKMGMTREGCLREYSKLNGQWCDELVYGILKTE